MINNIKSSAAFKQTQQQTKPARRFLRKFLNDWSMDFAAMLAYNLLIALLPIAVAIFGILGIILNNYPDAKRDVKNKIIDAFPADNTTQAGIRQVVDLAFNQLAKDAGVILAIGIIFAVFGSSRLFIAIDKCMTIVYRLPERTFLRQNVMAIGMIFLFIVVIPLMLVASSAPVALMNIIPGGGGRFGTFIGGMFFSLLIAFGLFETIYWIIPNKKMSFKTTWCGAMVGATTLEIFIILFPLYVRRFMTNYAGQIGFAVILLLFFFYFATILILGAQVNAYFFEKYPPLTEGLGTYLSQMHEEHGVGDAIKPLYDDSTEIQQNLTSSASSGQPPSQQKSGSLNKLWSGKQEPAIEPQPGTFGNLA